MLTGFEFPFTRLAAQTSAWPHPRTSSLRLRNMGKLFNTLACFPSSHSHSTTHAASTNGVRPRRRLCRHSSCRCTLVCRRSPRYASFCRHGHFHSYFCRAGPLSPVRKFLGVPYARAERLKRCEPPHAWQSTLKCTEFGPSFPQMTSPFDTMYKSKPGWIDRSFLGFSEDAFSVNVFAPGSTRVDGLPVMVRLST